MNSPGRPFCSDGRWLFATWTLHGALPAWRFPKFEKPASREAFAWVDAYLDSRRTGPTVLAEHHVARIVIDSLDEGARLGHYRLGPFAILPNHVHVLFLPLTPPARFVKSLKAAIARDANKLLNRTGQPFWQRESYDRWVRSGDERNRIGRYIEENPVRAGLVETIEAHPWSSAHINPTTRAARIPA